jgi:DNA-binding response OmpR family regulator
VLPATNGSETVLVVEEDLVVRKMVAGILTADGYRVLDVATPGEALRAARAHGQPVHLVAVDSGPPGSDGEKLVRALALAHPGLRVLATGSAEPRRLDWLAPEAQGALAKPFALSELLRAIRSLLDGKGVPATPPHFQPPG